MNRVKCERNTNHELLRLLAMYMIVFIHANMYLGMFCGGKWWNFFNGLVNGICNSGVTCFILISGYYGITFTWKKLIKMECMMIVFSLLETAILCMCFPEKMVGSVLLEQLVKSVMPFISRKYWFYSSYVCLFLLSGFIQKFIDGLERREFQHLLIILIMVFSVFPTLFYFEVIPDNGKGLFQMIMIYLIGRYMRRYHNISIPKGKAVLILVILWGLNGISHEFPINIGGTYHHLCKDNSITNLLIAIILFYLFKDLQIQSSFLNKVSSHVFAIFALNNSIVMVCMKWLKSREIRTSGSVTGFVFLMSVVFSICMGCLCIGAIRELLLGWLDRKLEYLGLKVLITRGKK